MARRLGKLESIITIVIRTCHISLVFLDDLGSKGAMEAIDDMEG